LRGGWGWGADMRSVTFIQSTSQSFLDKLPTSTLCVSVHILYFIFVVYPSFFFGFAAVSFDRDWNSTNCFAHW